MINIHASEFMCEVTTNGHTSRHRAARDGESPYERPVRIRAGKERGENAVITLRWDDKAAAIRVDVARGSERGILPKIEIVENDDSGSDVDGSVTIRVDILDREADVVVARVAARPTPSAETASSDSTATTAASAH